MTTANDINRKPGNRKLILALLALGAAAIFAASFYYRLAHPDLVVEVRQKQEQPPAMGQEGMEMVQALMQRLQQDPDDVAVLMQLGGSFLRMGQTERAVGFYRRATEAAPDDADAWRGLGMALFSAEAFPEAAEVLQRIIELDPADMAAHYNLGIVYKYYLERPADAEPHFRTVAEAGGADAELADKARKELE